MSRIRSVHPKQWRDSAFVRCSPHARLLALALRNMADDQGVFVWDLEEIKMGCLPGDAIDVAPLLAELIEQRQIAKYEVGIHQLGAIRNFCRFQRPKFPKQPRTMTEEMRNWVAMNERDYGNRTSSTRSITEIEPDDPSPVPRNEEIKPDDRPTFPPNGGNGRADRRGEEKSIPSPNGEGSNCAAAFAEMQAAAVAWNKLAKALGLATIRELKADRDRDRVARLRTRLTECGGLDGWHKALEKVRASSFLSGRAPRSGEHANWRFGFDLLIKPATFRKLIEGGYDDAPLTQPVDQSRIQGPI